MHEIRIGDRLIGDGHPCFLIAEAGSNHNGSLEQAKRLIDVAAEAGADAVKFQLFRAPKLYTKAAGQSDYLRDSRSIYEIIAEMELPYAWLPALAAHCREKRIMFLASVFDEESVEELDPHVEAFKIASYELTHIPLLRCIAKRGKPVIMSTGASQLEEVAESVKEFRGAGSAGLALMQCTAAYPAPLEALNTRAITTMRAAFELPVGLSDHSRDPLVGPLLAIAAGASLIEKHFTLSNELPGPDHRFALEPGELRLMCERVRAAERAVGDGRKVVHPVETELRFFARRSIFTVRDIVAGEVLSTDNIAVLRCGKVAPGLEPKRFPEILGRRARRNIRANVALTAEDCG